MFKVAKHAHKQYVNQVNSQYLQHLCTLQELIYIYICTTEALEIKGAANSVCLLRIVVKNRVCGLGVYGCG